jgi:hypothetical protein
MRLSILLGSLALGFAVAPARADTPGVAGTLEQSSSTTAKEKVDFAASAVKEIDAAVVTVQKLLDQAQKEKNTEQIECLQRKLTPLKALAEVSKNSSNALQQFLASNDAVHADLEYRKIAVALSKARDFLAEAQACVGETGARRGDAVVSVEEGATGQELPLAPDEIENNDPRVSPN